MRKSLERAEKESTLACIIGMARCRDMLLGDGLSRLPEDLGVTYVDTEIMPLANRPACL